MSKNAPFNSILVVGGGAWGTALATLAARAGIATTLWARESEVVSAINDSHENRLFLPGIELPESLVATSDLDAANSAEAIVFVVPAQFSRKMLSSLRDATGEREVPLALCSKGIERESGNFLTEIAKDTWPEAIPAVLSGPSFAADVARGLPTAVTLACADQALGRRWQQTLGSPHFRAYLSDDLVGAEIGGAVKNVLAIACGIIEGKGLGESARAALIARGFAELQRLGVALGANPQTMAGLSGLGDLILTCSSRQSRNMSLGFEIGRGKSASDILASRNSVSEGAATARPLVALAERHNVEMPICMAVAAIIDGQIGVDDAIKALLHRPTGLE